MQILRMWLSAFEPINGRIGPAMVAITTCTVSPAAYLNDLDINASPLIHGNQAYLH